MKKIHVIEILKSLPDEFDSEILIEHLILDMKLEEAERDIAEGRVFSHEEVVRETEEWFKQ